MGIRDLILAAILLPCIPLSVMRPFFGLLVFSWLAYMRPGDMTWGINQFRPSLWIAVATVAGVFLNKNERLLVLEKRTLLMGALLAAVGAATLLATNPQLALADTTAGGFFQVAKVIFIAMLTTGLVRTKDRVRLLMLVIAGSIGLLAMKSFVGGVLNPGVAMHGPGGMIRDNNDYGLFLVMAVPLIAYASQAEKDSPLLRAGLVIMAVACVAGVLLTRSRGGAVALAVLALIWMFRLRRNWMAWVFAPLAFALVIILTPPQLFERVRELFTGELDLSAQYRLIAWEKAMNMGADKPLFGVGPGNFQAEWPNYLPATGIDPIVTHNTLFHMLAESGVITLALYLVLHGVTLITLWRVSRRAKDKWRKSYADALFLSLAAFHAGSMFLSRTHFDLPYHLVGISVSVSIATVGARAHWFGLQEDRSQLGDDEVVDVETAGA